MTMKINICPPRILNCFKHFKQIMQLYAAHTYPSVNGQKQNDKPKAVIKYMSLSVLLVVRENGKVHIFFLIKSGSSIKLKAHANAMQINKRHPCKL